MKTLIVYATKYGAAREIAERLKARMEGAVVAQLGGGAPGPEGYDCVIIGSSVYAGQLRKEAREYVALHAAALKTTRLGLFVSGLSPEGIEGYLSGNYDKDVVAHAAATAMLGGAFDPAKGSFFERLVMRLITRTAKSTNTISDERIDGFAEALKRG